MKFLSKIGLTTLLNYIKTRKLFGYKSIVDQAAADRRKYLLEIDYDADLKIDWDLVTIDGFEAPDQQAEILKIT